MTGAWFTMYVQVHCDNVLLVDSGPNNPGVVLVSVSAGKEECGVDIQRPADGFPVQSKHCVSRQLT